MKTSLLLPILASSILASCSSTPAAPQRRPNLGTVGVVCRPGSDRLKVERPASAKERFTDGMTGHAKCVIGAGADLCSVEYGALIGLPLIYTVALSPITGAVNSTRGVPLESGLRHQQAIRQSLNTRDWNGLMAQKIKVHAPTGKSLAWVQTAAGDAATANASFKGADTRAEVELWGPSLLVTDGWSPKEQVRVALRVNFVSSKNDRPNHVVWIRIQDGPKRTQAEWAADPKGLEREISRAMDQAAKELAQKMTSDDGSGRVVASN